MTRKGGRREGSRERGMGVWGDTEGESGKGRREVEGRGRGGEQRIRETSSGTT